LVAPKEHVSFGRQVLAHTFDFGINQISNCEAALQYIIPDLKLFMDRFSNEEEVTFINSHKLSIDPYDLRSGLELFPKAD